MPFGAGQGEMETVRRIRIRKRRCNSKVVKRQEEVLLWKGLVGRVLARHGIGVRDPVMRFRV